MIIKTILNGNRDLGQDDEIRVYIDKRVEILRITPFGMIEIRTEDGKLFRVPRRNLG